jgi:hypothetical protein
MIVSVKTLTYSSEDIDGINVCPFAGKWIITQSLQIRVTAKPNWLHRKMARLLLGWEWEEKK